MVDPALVFGKKKWRWFSKGLKIRFTSIISEIWGLVDPFFQTAQVESFVEEAITSGEENLYPLIDWTMERGTNQEKLQLGEVLVIVQCFLQIRQYSQKTKRTDFGEYRSGTLQVRGFLGALQHTLGMLRHGLPPPLLQQADQADEITPPPLFQQADQADEYESLLWGDERDFGEDQ